MQKSLMILLAASLVLSSCSSWSESRANPRNWFGKSRSQPVSTVPDDSVATNPLIPQRSGRGLLERPDAVDLSVPVYVVSELVVEPTPTGAIIRATGLAQRQGAYAAVLRPDEPDGQSEKGVLSFTFRVVYPEDATPAGSEHTRTIFAAQTLSRKNLEGIHTVRVRGETNVRESRRR